MGRYEGIIDTYKSIYIYNRERERENKEHEASSENRVGVYTCPSQQHAACLVLEWPTQIYPYIPICPNPSVE